MVEVAYGQNEKSSRSRFEIFGGAFEMGGVKRSGDSQLVAFHHLFRSERVHLNHLLAVRYPESMTLHERVKIESHRR
jgi:hypothetical protein